MLGKVGGAASAQKLLADVLFGEVGNRDIEFVAHVTPQCSQHLLEEGVTILLTHKLLGGMETLNGNLVCSAILYQYRVFAVADGTMQVDV